MTKQCPVCGTYVSDDSNFCNNCGTDLTRPPYSHNADSFQRQTPPPMQPCYDSNNAFDSAGPEGKSRGIAALLAIFLGSLGVHYFYCDKVLAGVLTILLSIITCFTLWPMVMFAQGIYLLCISNAEFERKFVAGNSSFPVF